jgi:hypothetical protein
MSITALQGEKDMRLTLHTLLQQPARLLLITATLFALSPYPCTASYLADLEAEAKSTDVQGEPNNEQAWSHKTLGMSDELPKGMTQEEFEKNLQKNYYGSFIFYDKLSQWNKKQVYNTYVETNDIEQIRREIKIRMTK